MPTDSQGKYHLNNQKMRSAAKKSGQNNPVDQEMGKPDTADMGEDVPHATMHDHGDGTGHTEMADGTRHEHGDMDGIKAKLDALLCEEQGEGEGPQMAHHGAKDSGDWA